MLTYIVVDTSYWVELFKVPGHCKEENYQEIKQRFDVVLKGTARLYLSIPVLFELANHIAHVSNGAQRRELTKKFSITVKKGTDIEDPSFNMLPYKAFSLADELVPNLLALVDHFESELSPQGLGFTDSSIILEAKSLKTEINKVHIWTLDKALKAREPDTESNVFTGV